jgi:hypothetical protein
MWEEPAKRRELADCRAKSIVAPGGRSVYLAAWQHNLCYMVSLEFTMLFQEYINAIVQIYIYIIIYYKILYTRDYITEIYVTLFPYTNKHYTHLQGTQK